MQPSAVPGGAAVAGELALRLHELSRSIRRMKQHAAERHDAVPAGLLSVLLHAAETASGCHGRDLATRTGLDPSTISRAVASLVAHGWVVRGADPSDGRAHVLTVTAEGEAALAGATRRYSDILARALAGWSPADVTALSDALGRLAADIECSLDDSHPLEAAR